MNSPNQMKQNELVEVRGDATLPTGERGKASGLNLANTATAKPIVLYRDKLLTLDVYSLPGQPMYIILYCPLCDLNRPRKEKQKQSLRISEDNKKIDFDPKALPNIPGFSSPQEIVNSLDHVTSVDQIRGRISVEPFGCTWEEKSDLRRGFGFGVCGWKVVIENNIARDI